MKDGTNPRRASFEQLGQLVGVIVDYLSRLLTFDDVSYWLNNKTELKNVLRGLFVSEKFKSFSNQLHFIKKCRVNKSEEIDLTNFFKVHFDNGRIKYNPHFEENIISKLGNRTREYSSSSFSLYQVIGDINRDEILENFSFNGLTLYIKDIDAFEVIASLLKEQINGENGILSNDGDANVIGCSFKSYSDELVHFFVRWVKKENCWYINSCFDGFPGDGKIILYYRNL